MSELRKLPNVGKLLQLLYESDDEAGLLVIELPESLRDEKLLTACEGESLIEFIRRKHFHVGGGVHRKVVLEPNDGSGIWQIAELHKPLRKSTRGFLKEVLSEEVPDEIRHRVRLTYRGRAEAAHVTLLKAKKRTKPGRKRGGQKKYNEKADQRLADAWNTGRYKSIEAIAFKFDMNAKEAKQALDRVRYHRKRSKKPPSE